jgi:hypothetical protein
MGAVWAIVFWLVALLTTAVIFGFAAKAMGHSVERAGEVVGGALGIPFFLVFTGVSIWLTAIGKLPGTKKR